MKHALLLALTLLVLAGCSKAYRREQLMKALHENPDVLLEVLAEHDADLFEIAASGQRSFQERLLRERLEAEIAEPFTPEIDAARPFFGPEDASVTIVVYSDFLCPYCAKGAARVKALAAAHPKDVRMLFKHFASGESSRRLARRFEALGEQSPEAAWKFHDLAFAGQQDLSERGEAAVKDILAEIAAEFPLDKARLARDFKRADIKARLDADEKEARSFDFQGTPTFLLNGVSVRGAVSAEEFEAVYNRVADKGPKTSAEEEGKKAKKQ